MAPPTTVQINTNTNAFSFLNNHPNRKNIVSVLAEKVIAGDITNGMLTPYRGPLMNILNRITPNDKVEITLLKNVEFVIRVQPNGHSAGSTINTTILTNPERRNFGLPEFTRVYEPIPAQFGEKFNHN